MTIHMNLGEDSYEPAREAIRSIEQGLNARIVIGVCDLFYYASNILDERCEDMYSSEHQIDYHGIDKKQRRENQAKRQGILRGLAGLLVSELLEAQAASYHTRMLRGQNLYPHHPRHRKDTAEQAHTKRPATVLCKTQKKR